jgi:sugar transferase (PEP-CTERM/EpsH1 system associated)
MSRLRVLFLTHRLPYAPNRGDRVRSYHILQNLAPQTDLTLASLVHDAEEAANVARLAGVARVILAPVPHLANRLRAVVALASSQPITGTLLSSPTLAPAMRELVEIHPPDVVLAFCSSMAYAAFSPPLDRFPLVIDMVDADSVKWDTLSRQTAWPLSWVFAREARTLAAFEASAMRRAHATFAVNQREVDLLRKLAPDARLQVLESGVDVDTFTPPATLPPSPSSRVVFCGVMNYAPNEAGAIWLARDVWPHVRRAAPAAELRIVGASPTAKVRALNDAAQAITVTGYVPDVRSELWSAAVATAPLHMSRGVQTKVLEAVASGLPCVITSEVREGLPDRIKPACSVADTAEGFASAIVDWLRRSPSERRTLPQAELAELAWNNKLRPLLPQLEEAARAVTKTRAAP